MLYAVTIHRPEGTQRLEPLPLSGAIQTAVAIWQDARCAVIVEEAQPHTIPMWQHPVVTSEMRKPQEYAALNLAECVR